MTAPLFTSNDADISKLEGLYLKERNPPATVSEASLNTVAIFGATLKGPVGKAVEITSESRFLEVFGGRDKGDGVLVNSVWKFLLNKGLSKVVIARVAAAAAVKASFTLETVAAGSGTAVIRVDASSVGAWGNTVKIKVTAATDGVANHFNLTVLDTLTGKTTLFENLSTDGTDDNLAAKLGTDDGRLIDATKLANGRPCNTADITGADVDGYISLGQTIASFVSVVGSDDTLADSDFYGTDKGLDLLKAAKGIGVVTPAEWMSASLKAQIKTAAAASCDRLFLIGADSESVAVAAAVTDVATYRSDRLVYCYNHAYTIDPTTGAEVLTRPEAWMAAVLANTDVDIHVGEEDTKPFLAGITRLHRPALARGDYETLKAAGIAAMEVDLGSPVFVSGVTTSLTSGKTEIARRRCADFLQLSVAEALRFFVKKKNTEEKRKAMAAMVTAFLGDLQKAQRVVEAFQVDGEILNTTAQRAAGIERLLMRVKIIGHMLAVVLETEIGTGVTITVQ